MRASGVVSAAASRAAEHCQIWGILNITPDSFSDGGEFVRPADALAHARRMLDEGADVIDVGGASSRPRGALYGAGAPELTPAEECARALPVVTALVRELGATVSIDTRQAEVAAAALDAGACIVNDVSCGASRELLAVAAERGARYVLMHTRGDGAVEPPNTEYADVVGEVVAELLAAVARAEASGIHRARLLIDPGLGFAKTARQSARVLGRIDALVATGLPVLCGPSRKGFIAELAPAASGERPPPRGREPGTLAAVTAAVLQGASAVRVHDVAAGRQAARLAEAMRAEPGRAC
ncbi:MAG: dihydropteroate synthase [Polyangiales bacterium]